MRLLLFVLILSCASQRVGTNQLVDKNLPGYYKPANGSEFNFMDIKCDGNFVFKTYDHEDKGVYISQINEASFETKPQMIGHYYEVVQWPSADNNYKIRLRYIVNSMLKKYSGSLSRFESESAQEVYSFRKVKRYSCH